MAKGTQDDVQEAAVVIRCACHNDAGDIASVLRASFREYRELYTTRAFAATAPATRQILIRLQEGPIWIAEQHGALVGTVSATQKGDSLYVRGMCVLPQLRGQRIGYALLQKVKEFASASGCRRLFLSTTPFLTRAIHLYEDYGFRPVDEGPHDLFGTPLFTMEKRLDNDMKELKKKLKDKYGRLARRAKTGAKADCSAVTENLYSDDDVRNIPDAAINASLGSGNPAALAQLREGQIVLDLGSGGGLDVLLCARRVGPGGKAYGLDMTDEMLALAKENQRKAGVTNVEFLKGEIEQIPLPDCAVDVIISNCVINLSTDKGTVFREALRVLKPGGQFAVSDIVSLGSAPRQSQQDIERRIGCVAGTLEASEYQSLLAEAVFESIEITPTREHDAGLISAFIRARKPRHSPENAGGTRT